MCCMIVVSDVDTRGVYGSLTVYAILTVMLHGGISSGVGKMRECGTLLCCNLLSYKYHLWCMRSVLI